MTDDILLRCDNCNHPFSIDVYVHEERVIIQNCEELWNLLRRVAHVQELEKEVKQLKEKLNDFR